jgi:surface protein
MKNRLLLHLFAVVAAMMCAFGADAAEAYACYTSSNTTLTFYYDDQRSSRPGSTYDLNTGSNNPDWSNEAVLTYTTRVIFDPSFADARPTTTYRWFFGMMKLQSFTGLNNLNTSEVTNMGYMFAHCSKLTSLDLSSFNTSKVTNMECMFFYGSGLTSLKLSSFNTSLVTNMERMFAYCSNLKSIYVDNGWSTSAVTASTEMFVGCTSLVGGQGTTYNAGHTDAAYAHIDGGTSNPGYLTPNIQAYACYTGDYKVLTFYYDDMRPNRIGKTYNLNTGGNDPGWGIDGNNANVTKVVFDESFADARPTTTYNWFKDMANLQTILGISNLNTSEVTNMGNMFRGCTGLTSLDLSNFNTSKVNVMQYMFYGCTNLRTIYGGDAWNTDAVTGALSMFLYCNSLVGGQGTTYSSANGLTYAHIDGGPSNPGYFTTVGTEAYACYTPSNTTLTFYYDTQRSSRPGTTYDLNIGESDPGWYTDNIEVNVTKVVFHPYFAGVRPTTTFRWLHNMKNLQSIIGLSYLKTSEVTNMAYMFMSCNGLTSLDVSHFNTAKVTNMQGMFNSCTGLTSLDLSSFNTSKVTNMNYMFYNCSSLTSLDLRSFNTAKVTAMGFMFSTSSNLTTIYVGEGWSTVAVTGSVSMFTDCTHLVGGRGTTYDASHVDKAYAHIDGGPSNPGYFTDPNTLEAYACYTPSNTTLTFYCDKQRSSRPGTTYDLNEDVTEPGWVLDGTNANVTKVVFDESFADARPTTTFEWFYGMQNLQSLTGMTNLNTSKVTNMSLMFMNCTGLTSLDVSNFNTSQVTTMASMFSQCSSLTSLDLSSFSTSNVNAMYNMFRSCGSLQTIYVGSDWTVVAVGYSDNMFLYDTSLVGGQGTTYDASHVNKTYAHIDGGPSNPGYFTYKNAPKAYACYTPENTTLTFYYDYERSSRQGTTYDLNTGEHDPGWRTDGANASVTNVVFDPSFTIARPTTTYQWFYLMGNLQTITGIEYLNTSEVTNMAHMFNSCSKLTSLDLSSFNTSKVTEMLTMFYNCSGLTSLDLSGFNTANVTNMFNMFGSCSSLTSIDLSSFNTSQVTDMGRMFYGCSNLITVYVGEDWSTEAVTNHAYMFQNNTNLVGGQGTTYNDSNPKDKTYAHIDGGPSNPGYFSAKGAGLRGDVNGDTLVNISDAIVLINYLSTGNTTGVNLANADCTLEGQVNISDAISLINYLLTGVW